MKMIKAVIFDMDGLMFDTERPYIDLLVKICRERNLNFPTEYVRELIGVSSVTVEKYENNYPGIIEAMNQIDRDYDDYFFSLYPTPGSANKKGLEELFDYLNENGYKKAIASSSRERHIKNLVRYSNVDMKLDAIVSSHSDFPSKPDPAVFIEAAKRLDVNPDECLVLEDSKYGIMAANRAGMHRVWIPDIITDSSDFQDNLEFKCNDLSEVISILETALS